MKVLFYGLNFAPELTGIGKFSGETVQYLADAGHDVRVIAAPPYYPEWRVHAGHRRRWWRREWLCGARVLRCPLYVPRRPTGKTRMLHLASFAATSALPALWSGLTWRPDVVVTVEPTALVQPMALLAAGFGGAVAWLHVQDLEFDAAFKLGVIGGEGGRAARLAFAFERHFLRRFDRVSTITPNMGRRLRDKGLDPARAVQFPNWVDAAAIRPLDRPSPLRAALGVPADAVVALYSGNMGEKQGIEVLVEAARQGAGRADLVWLLCGEGAARARLEAAAAGLVNLRFGPLQPAERLNDLLNVADIHLLPQRADAADLVMPSKLGGMLASGRPVVASAAAGTQVHDAVQGCGLTTAPGDAGALADAVVALAGDAGLRARLGHAARLRAVQEWDRDGILGRFAAALQQAAAR
ncbi:MAG: WcaI family glycosyltransferase [Alphaproteobacteria bacterium]